MSLESRIAKLEQAKALTGFDADSGPGTIILRPGDEDPPPLKPGQKGRIILDFRGRDLPREDAKGADTRLYFDPAEVDC